MSDTGDHDPDLNEQSTGVEEESGFTAVRYDDGTITYPGHPIGPEGGEPVGEIDLHGRTATVITWTTATATPPGVREPNHLAIVAFEIAGEPVRAIGQLTTDDIEIGDTVEPVYCEQLRNPDAGIRESESQEWDGFRFAPEDSQ